MCKLLGEINHELIVYDIHYIQACRLHYIQRAVLDRGRCSIESGAVMNTEVYKPEYSESRKLLIRAEYSESSRNLILKTIKFQILRDQVQTCKW